jgi:hypothetical protein
MKGSVCSLGNKFYSMLITTEFITEYEMPQLVLELREKRLLIIQPMQSKNVVVSRQELFPFTFTIALNMDAQQRGQEQGYKRMTTAYKSDRTYSRY